MSNTSTTWTVDANTNASSSSSTTWVEGSDYETTSWLEETTPVADAFTNSYSLYVDGTDDYLDLGDLNLINTNDYSISIWFKTNNTSDEMVMISKGYNPRWKLYLDGDGDNKLKFEHRTLSDAVEIDSNSALNDDEWHHAVITADRDGSLLMYIDGTQQTDTASLNTDALKETVYDASAGSNYDFLIGSYSRNLTKDWEDYIDEVAVFSGRVLSSANVTSFYNSGEPADLSSESSLSGYWRFEEGSGSTVEDSSTNSNTGTLQNNATFTSIVANTATAPSTGRTAPTWVKDSNSQ